ncbi:MAG TPA: hypothetical protein GX527_01905 [Clostridiaceae bacterium]|nr:hypothetical protein [Clostridiaceae bacterium]
MNLFEIINITQLKKDYQIESFTLVDFTVGFDDLIYLLFSKNDTERIDGMFVNTIANTQYIVITMVFDWSSNSVCNTIFVISAFNFTTCHKGLQFKTTEIKVINVALQMHSRII